MAHILLIEDDDSVREMLVHMLGRLGHTCAEAGNGAVGLARADRERFDLVLTDLIMPEKEGIETIRDLRKTQPNLRIVAMSAACGGARGNYLEMAQMLGATGTLAKPFTHEQLDATIAAVLA